MRGVMDKRSDYKLAYVTLVRPAHCRGGILLTFSGRRAELLVPRAVEDGKGRGEAGSQEVGRLCVQSLFKQWWGREGSGVYSGGMSATLMESLPDSTILRPSSTLSSGS